MSEPPVSSASCVEELWALVIELRGVNAELRARNATLNGTRCQAAVFPWWVPTAALSLVAVTTQPSATSKVDPGSDVTLTVARNTGQVDLIATAGQAAWKNGSAALTFPGKETDTSPATVLETSPPVNGLITGVYKLAEPAVAGDHVRARVGLLKGATGTVTFLVRANGKVIAQVTDTADGKLKDFDADLSSAKGATSIEITVLAGAGSTHTAAVWQDLRLEPQIG